MYRGSDILYVYDLHYNFGGALIIEKFNPQLIFSQFKHCIKSVIISLRANFFMGETF